VPKMTPNLLAKMKAFRETVKHHTAELRKLEEDVLQHRAYCNRTIDSLVSVQTQTVKDIETSMVLLIEALTVTSEAIRANEYPVDVLPTTEEED
jgi:hypothetical protein